MFFLILKHSEWFVFVRKVSVSAVCVRFRKLPIIFRKFEAHRRVEDEICVFSPKRKSQESGQGITNKVNSPLWRVVAAKDDLFRHWMEKF